jgi:succinate dehydrogenase/fumarate reductase flavoprotein subunit
MIYDIVVVGSGIAGLMAAIEAKTDHNRVVIMTKSNVIKSNSAMASGGINATLDENDLDNIKQHYDDTFESTYNLADTKNIKRLVFEAPHIINKLVEYGVKFDRNDDDTIAQRSFGGGKSKRTCHIGDKTGFNIMQALLKKARDMGIEFLVNNYLLDISVTNGQVSGVIVLRRSDSNVVLYPTKSVVFAGGGYAGIYKGFSSNAVDYVGDTIAIALRRGLPLQDMEFIQFHPTGFKRSGYLVSEAARGEGGYLVNQKGERFVDELEKRDVVAKAVYAQIQQGNEVFLDLRHLLDEHIMKKLPSLYNYAHAQEGIDVTKELLPIKPVVHYSMGGIKSSGVKTAIKGLFVCGENASNGIHGANRLGGNSLLDGAIFGDLAGREARIFSENKEYLCIDYQQVIPHQRRVDYIFSNTTSKNFNAIRTSLGKVMFDKVGILRDEENLQNAFSYIKYLRRESGSLHTIDKNRSNNIELIAILELRNALEIAEAVIFSALKREESRGAHLRTDFPDMEPKFDKHLEVTQFGKLLKVDFESNKILSFLRKKLIN